MRPTYFDHLASGARVLAAWLALTATAAAQTSPPAGPEDLTVPPELRHAAPAGPALGGVNRAVHIPAVRRAAANGPAEPVKPRPAPSHPVDFGVVVRGGSATSRINSPTGTSQAVQESGSAVGAGMRFGF